MRAFAWGMSILVGALSLLCASSTQASRGFSARDEDAIREAVFRYQLKHNASCLKGKAGAYYLSTGKGQDPSDAIMKRFVGHSPPVRRFSAAVIKSKTKDLPPDEPKEFQGFWVRNKETGKPGTIFHAGSIRRLGRHLAEVSGGYYEGGLSASDNTYRVVRRRGRWEVLSDRLDAIAYNEPQTLLAG
jgi:hypothetical protein